MIPIPGWSYVRAMRERREKELADRREERHKKAVARRRKAKRGGKR